ncbi:hypothetical protein HN446_00295 [bacterium]|jgi:hypothetical protein|nr:hypothetical protein [bacterium]
MPGYKGHVIGGAVAFVLLFSFMDLSQVSHITFVEWFLFTIMGALFPDVDIGSKGQKLFYSLLLIVLAILAFYGRWFTCGILCFVSLFPILVRHRGLFHKWWFILIVPMPLMLYLANCWPKFSHSLSWATIFFMVGIFSHLLLDFKLKIFKKR